MTAAQMPSLDGRDFRMLSSTTSVVDPESPTVFRYREQDGLVWGEYAGDTVTVGRFVGSRDGDRIRISFGHVKKADGSVVTGTGESDIERGDDGLLRLVEHYEMHGAPQVSVCVEAPAG